MNKQRRCGSLLDGEGQDLWSRSSRATERLRSGGGQGTVCAVGVVVVDADTKVIRGVILVTDGAPYHVRVGGRGVDVSMSTAGVVLL